MRDEYDFSNAKRNPYAKKLKKQITINIDENTIDYFKVVSYTHLRAHETDSYLVCRLLLEKKKKKYIKIT